MAAQFERFYVDADTGRLIARRLRERLAAGAYDRFGDTDRFAEALTADLRTVNGDLHLGVQYAPGLPTDRPGSGGLTTPRPSRPGVPAPDEPQPTPAMLAEWRQANFGLERAARLEGNVGYLDVRGFFDVPEAFAATGAALAFLERTDAMIFDLREMPGGSGDMSNWLLSHFTAPTPWPASPSPTGRPVTRSSAGPWPRSPGRSVPTSPSHPDRPRHCLRGRGLRVRAPQPAPCHARRGPHCRRRAQQRVPRRRTRLRALSLVHPGDGSEDWQGVERVGVPPDVRVAPDSALETAHVLALQAIAGRTSDPERRHALELTAEALQAQLHRHRVPARLLAHYAGTYGERTLTVRGDTLMFRRVPYPPPH